jgi:hypothetical protein
MPKSYNRAKGHSGTLMMTAEPPLMPKLARECKRENIRN